MAENLREIILSVKTGTVDPTTVIPDFIGQAYLNTVTNVLFFAKSLTVGDYEEIIDINSTVATQAHDQNSDTKLDDGQVNEVISSDLRTHLDNLTKHRLINDGISTTTNLYSASQIDALIVASTSNLDIKNSVVTIADTNVTLSGEQTLNGVVTSGSRVGIVGQTLPEKNGIYNTSSGAWTRATDADADSEVTNGLSFFVSNSGSTKNGNQYILITPDPIILDTTALTFIEVPRIVLGTTSGTATEGNDPRIPIQDENDALVGTNGTPSNINKYVTNSDIRLHNQNTDTDLDPTFEATFVKKVDTINVLSDITSAGADIDDAVTKKHTQNTDTILTTDGATALLNAGILKINLLSDDAVNIQIDEIRARDTDGLKLFDDSGNGIFIQDGGFVGIGRTDPNALLDFNNPINNRVISLFRVADNDHQFFGFGINPSVTRYQVPNSTSDHIFYSGINSTSSLELMRITGDGDIGIGISTPSEKLDVNGNIKTAGYIDFGVISSVTHQEGRVYYDTEDKALSLKTDIVGSTQSLGQEFWIRVINKTGVSIPDGSVVLISGFDATSGRPTIALAKADVVITSDVIGITTNTMANNAEGFVTSIGFLNDLDTTSFSSGDELFLSDTVAGGITSTKPLIVVSLGFATKIDAVNGQILTSITRRVSDKPFFAELSDSTNQKPIVTTPVVITFNTNDNIRGIIHSITNAPEDIIIEFDGTYTAFAQPQVEKTSGGGSASFHMWARVGSDDKGTTTSVSIANPSVIATTNPHGLTSGQTVKISNTTTTPDINTEHIITVTGANTFTIPVDVTSVVDGAGDWRRILDINDDLPNTNVELNLFGNEDSSVIPLIFTRDFLAGEKLNMMQSTTETGVGLGLVTSTPSGEPAIPSIIFVIDKIN